MRAFRTFTLQEQRGGLRICEGERRNMAIERVFKPLQTRGEQGGNQIKDGDRNRKVSEQL